MLFALLFTLATDSRALPSNLIAVQNYNVYELQQYKQKRLTPTPVPPKLSPTITPTPDVSKRTPTPSPTPTPTK